MFCQHCGKELDQDAVFCPNCGTRVSADPNGTSASPAQEKDEFFKAAPAPAPVQQPVPRQPAKTNTMAVVGFVLSFFVTIAGLICSIVGLKQCNELKEEGKGFAIAGIVISSVSLAITFLTIVIVIANLSYLPYY